MEKCSFCKNKSFDDIKSRKLHEYHCKSFFERYPDLNIEEIRLRYNSGESAFDIADSLSINRHQIYRVFEKIGIKTKTLKESSNDPVVKSKRKETNITRYGSDHNFRKNHPSRIEWQKKLMDAEGITNIGQRESVKKSIRKTIFERYGVDHYMELDLIKDKIKSTCLEKYGVDHPMKNQEISSKLFDYFLEKYGTFFPQNRQFSKIHKKVCDLLNENNIGFTNEFKISCVDRKYFFDIKIESFNRIIEVNGDYWHCNPQIYNPDDIFYFKKIHTLAKDKWKEDADKIKAANKNGFNVLTIWESDIKDKRKWELTKEIIIEYAKGKN
jgi:G:T-mismatch repair DNA endonuclease (very short patch repair protein)